jgi:hypothetical protein
MIGALIHTRSMVAITSRKVACFLKPNSETRLLDSNRGQSFSLILTAHDVRNDASLRLLGDLKLYKTARGISPQNQLREELGVIDIADTHRDNKGWYVLNNNFQVTSINCNSIHNHVQFSFAYKITMHPSFIKCKVRINNHLHSAYRVLKYN